jgi:MFS family permease
MEPVTFSVLQLPLAWAGLALGAAVLVGVALSIASERTYENLLDDEGRPEVSLGMFIAVTAVIGTLLSAFLVMCWAFLNVSIHSNAGSRFAKRGDEPDAIGALMNKENSRPG